MMIKGIIQAFHSSLAIISMGVENFLILTRVTALWDHNKMATRLMLILYTLSYGCTVITSVITILHISDGFVYSRVGRLCVSTKTSPELVAIWIAPFLFDIAVLIFTVSNALARPRRADMQLAKVLKYDGIAFFVQSYLYDASTSLSPLPLIQTLYCFLLSPYGL
ncbi:hypothetical protein SERLADRAFT_403559 [Serpula lacrymans var. lacrymans S7.9]|uniref:G-protein coupled receptors family 1 profile domain-containing protein n=1 Tax=Serpula lacrymans var. lacrymans (strain S7.9) TaxID=578457 RepID=F8PDH9_SERL9|nr:uncharacterized protein SERLADRAFT_403559 [Serpula lacrymans var. lacrymans S7.9]EGO18800.1 hypothetical protein SERLADRAFT_403559 [Serpula lacrymans var. lacrymans S7.9]